MSVNKYLEGLAKPFDAECVKWRIQVTNNEKTSGLAVAYLDSRTIVLYQFMMIVLKSG